MVWNVGYNALGEIFVWYEAAILSSTLYFVNSSLMLSSFSANKDTLTAILMQWTRVDNCDSASFTAYTVLCTAVMQKFEYIPTNSQTQLHPRKLHFYDIWLLPLSKTQHLLKQLEV